MFQITEETRKACVDIIRDHLAVDHVSDEQLEDIIDEMIAVVKRQFGM